MGSIAINGWILLLALVYIIFSGVHFLVKFIIWCHDKSWERKERILDNAKHHILTEQTLERLDELTRKIGKPKKR